MRIVLVICAAAALMAGPAMAQPYDYGPGGYDRDYRSERHYDRGYDRDYRDGRRWRDHRGGDSWRRHVRRCLYAYRSYNPHTDRYVVRRGVTARCRL